MKISALVSSNGKDTIVSTNVIVLAAVPSIIELSWIDINGANIGGRVIGYLDKVKLVVKTKNIPANEILKVTIYEDEYADGHDKDSSRNMGTYDAKVNNKGVAEINFNNIKV
ncbi:hypothetical protein [Chryseobacterium sp.]|uniref:hypothetical protein n=1 Tax=Chryseobacterium sp. TaxID=1871047 RepID=UPI00388EF56E